MSFPAAEAVDLLRAFRAFLEEEAPSAIFASPEDANYFRNAARALPAAPPPKPAKAASLPPLPKIEPKKPEPAPLPSPAPVPASPKIETPKKPEPVPAPKPEKIPPSIPLSDVRKTFLRAFPQFPLIDEIPNDAIAVKIAERWKTKNKTAPISILSLHEPPEQRALLEQIAKALDVSFLPARVINAEPIEKEKQWEAFLSVPDLKMAIACDYTLWQLNSLMAFYKENPTQGHRTLGQVPLFLLPDLSLYLKDPLLKRSLWKALCQKLSS